MLAAPDDSLPVPEMIRSAGITHTRASYRRGDVIFTQGDACDHVRFIESGTVSLAVTSPTGKVGVVAVLGAGNFLGEGSLAGQPLYPHSATAITASAILAVGKRDMLRLLHHEHRMSDRFIAQMLVRNLRSESDLVDHLVNSCERRLARTLLLLAGYGKGTLPDAVLLTLSQETLGAMVGTTRSRINLLLHKFKKRGFIEYAGPCILKIHSSLLTMVLDE
jgi:CRP/FNR family cyclic AMP-dependent transcriptional regulator